MDREVDAESTLDLFSVISGSTENSSYDVVYNSFPLMDKIKSRQEAADLSLSPVIPTQDIEMTAIDLETVWNADFMNTDVEHLNQKLQPPSSDENTDRIIQVVHNRKYEEIANSKRSSMLCFGPYHRTSITNGANAPESHGIPRPSTYGEDMETDTGINDMDSLNAMNDSVSQDTEYSELNTLRNENHPSQIAMSDTVRQEGISIGSFVEQWNQENPPSQIEDSQVDLFESDNLSGQPLQRHEELYTRTQESTPMCSKENTNSCTNSQQTTFYSSQIALGVSQSSGCNSTNKETEIDKDASNISTFITNASDHNMTSSTKVIVEAERVIEENVCEKTGHGSLPATRSSCEPNSLPCQSLTADDAASDVSSCTIPPNISHSEDHPNNNNNNNNGLPLYSVCPPESSLRSICVGNEHSIRPSNYHSTDDPEAKTKASLDAVDVVSEKSISIMVPGIAYDNDNDGGEKSISKANNISSDEQVYGADELNSSKTNRDDVAFQKSPHPKHGLNSMSQERSSEMVKNETSGKIIPLSSQGISSSADLFLSSIEVSEMKNIQDGSQMTQTANVSGVMCDKCVEKGKPSVSIPPLKMSRRPGGKNQHEGELIVDSIMNVKKNIVEPTSQKGRYDDFVIKEHEKKLLCLQRLESLCNQIASHVKEKDSVDMGSYIHRCEYLITKMKAMQKEEKEKLCSSLKGVGTSKWKRKALKKQLEYLKSRHQTLVGIVSKYSTIKDRVKTKKEQRLHKISNAGCNDGGGGGGSGGGGGGDGGGGGVEASKNKPEVNNKSLCGTRDETVEENSTQHDVLNSASPIERMEGTQCEDNNNNNNNNTAESEDDCIVISESSGEKCYVESAVPEKKARDSSSDAYKSNEGPTHSLPISSNHDLIIAATRSTTIYRNSVLRTVIGNVSQSSIVFGETKIEPHTSGTNKNIVSVSDSSLDKNTVVRIVLPNKRKSAPTFNPPPMKIKPMESLLSLNTTTNESSDANDNEVKLIHPSGEERSVVVDDILFTEFQDPSSEINRFANQKDNNRRCISEMISMSKAVPLDTSQRDRCVTVDDVVFTEVPDSDTSSKNQPTHDNYNSRLSNERKNVINGTETPALSNYAGIDTVHRDTKDTDAADIRGESLTQSPTKAPLTIATTQSDHSANLSLRTTTNDRCASPREPITDQHSNTNNIIITTQDEQNVLSQVVTEPAMLQIASAGDENLPDEVEEIDSQIEAVRCNQERREMSEELGTAMLLTPKGIKVIDKERKEGRAMYFSTQIGNLNTLKEPATCFISNHVAMTTATSVDAMPIQTGHDNNNNTPFGQAQGVERTSGNQSSQIENNATSKKSVSVLTYNNNSSPVEVAPTSFSNVKPNVPHICVDDANPTSLQKPSVLPSPCSTQGSSLFPVSSREIIIRRNQSLQLQPPTMSIPVITNPDNFCQLTSSAPAYSTSTKGNDLLSEDPLRVSADIDTTSKISIQQRINHESNNITPVAAVDATSLSNSNTKPNVPDSSSLKLKEVNSASALQKLQRGPPSPCSTQGSSLFPVSSREIIVRRAQSRRSPPIIIDPLPTNSDNNGHGKITPASTITPTIGNNNVLYVDPTRVSDVNTNTSSKVSFQHINLKSNIPSQFNLEPSAVSLNNILTSSLCAPQKENPPKYNPKPKRTRKKKTVMVSDFTQTSPEIPTSAFCIEAREKGNKSNLTETEMLPITFSGEMSANSNVIPSVDNRITHSGRCEESTTENNNYNNTSSSIIYSIINSLRSIRLISDQELIPASKGGFPEEFWDEDFSSITMSLSVWNSVVDW